MNESAAPTQQHARAARRRWRRVLLLAISVFLGLAMIEVGFRVLGPAPLQPRRIEPGVPFVARPGNRLEYRPGAQFASIYDPAADSRGYFGPTGRVEYRINEFGFRGPAPEIPKPPGVVRIACLGDSFTFGEGVRYEDTWPAVLAGRLNSARPAGVTSYDVINAGVQGYGLVDELLWYGLRIEKLNPDIIVLAFFMNDLAPTSETIRINDEMHRPESATGLARYSAVADWFQRRRRAERLQAQYFQSIRESFNAAGRETLDQALSGFKAYADERGVQLLVVVFPVLWGLDANYPLRDQHAIVSRACDRSGIRRLDLLDVYAGTRAETLWVHPTDQHPNEIAQRRAADAVADVILGKKQDP